MKPLLKWPGSKEKELSVIREYTPEYTGRYVEPFFGGGAVFFDINKDKCFVNDKSVELINFYNCIKKRDKDFIVYLQRLCDEFSSISGFVDNHRESILQLYKSEISVHSFLSEHTVYFSSIASDYSGIFNKELSRNLTSKIDRSAKLERENGIIPDSDRVDNIESALKSAYYMYVRYLFNYVTDFSDGKKAAVFFFIREYCYSSMFRYNSSGEFNVPYGGITYNRKDFQKKIDYLLSDEIYNKLKTAHVYCEDFQDFINTLELNENDFIFLDPPYDSDFSTYARNTFGKDEQVRLCECLKSTKAKFLLIIKNTDFIYNLYKDYFNIGSFDKRYTVSFMNRNEKKTEHLIITNYLL